VTNAAARLPRQRRRKIAEQLIEALVALPLVSADKNVVFHGDPHAGNLLYNSRTSELIILDWALRERLSRAQRRHLALLLITMTLRDPAGTLDQVLALSEGRVRRGSRCAQLVEAEVKRLLEERPLTRVASGADVMQLLERAALSGLRFPRSLIVLSKAMLTLDGILADVGGDGLSVGATVTRRIAQHWIADRRAFHSPLNVQDWITLPGSALLYGSRVWLRCEQALLDRFLPDGRAPQVDN
jgi:ubiquinone biosynthesis protein